MKDKKRIILLAAGPLLFLICCFLIPKSIFPELASRAAVGTVAWMAFWWMTGPVDYAVTAFLPIAINAIVQMCDMSAVIANYASETILLLLGASILTIAWEETGLDKRIASALLCVVGNKLRTQLIFWFIVSALLSSVLSNSVVCATVTPIAVSMLRYVGEGDIAKSKIGTKLLMYIVFAIGVGGVASPLGGAMNLVTVDYIQQYTGEEYMYTSWVIRFLPVTITLIVSNIIFMLRDVKKTDIIGGSKDHFREEYKKMPKMNFEEKASLVLFLIATAMAFTRQFYQDILPGLKPAYSFIACAILSFLITRKDGTKVMVWSSVQKKIIWGLIFVFAGGLAAGTIINKSGAAEAISNLVADMGLTGGIMTIMVILAITMLMSNVTSNTATAAVTIPIVISIIEGIGMNPIPFIYIATVGVNLAYMLPTSIRAIPVGYGLIPKNMLKEGWKLTLLVLILMTGLCFCLLKFWDMFSTV